MSDLSGYWIPTVIIEVPLWFCITLSIILILNVILEVVKIYYTYKINKKE